MYKVTAYFKEGKAFNYFKNVYDAIDFKDDMDAHYPIRTDLEKVKTMREFVYTSWNSVMNAEVNPLLVAYTQTRLFIEYTVPL